MKEQQKEIIQHYVHSYNNFEIDGMVQHLSDDIVFENISNGEMSLRIEGLEAFKKQALSAKQYFKEREQKIESWAQNGSKVTINISYKAILAIDLPNGLKKGDTLELKGTSDFEFKNGKIISIIDKS